MWYNSYSITFATNYCMPLLQHYSNKLRTFPEVHIINTFHTLMPITPQTKPTTAQPYLSVLSFPPLAKTNRMMEPQLGFGSPYTVAGYTATLLILGSIAAASRSLAPAVASDLPLSDHLHTYAAIVCSDSLLAWILAGSNLSAAISATN